MEVILLSDPARPEFLADFRFDLFRSRWLSVASLLPVTEVCAMPVTDESIQNFRRGKPGDACLGIYHSPTKTIHLALVEPRDQDLPKNPKAGGPDLGDQVHADIKSRTSKIGGKELGGPLMGAGGHTVLAAKAGYQASLIGAGMAAGADLYCFSIIKTSSDTFKIGTI